MIERTDDTLVISNARGQELVEIYRPAVGRAVLALCEDRPYKSFTRDELREIADAIVIVTNNATLWA